MIRVTQEALEAYRDAVLEAAGADETPVPVEVMEAAGRNARDVQNDVKHAIYYFSQVPEKIDSMTARADELREELPFGSEKQEILDAVRIAEERVRAMLTLEQQVVGLDRSAKEMADKLFPLQEQLKKFLASARKPTEDWMHKI